MTDFLEVPGGRLAYDVTGDGPLVVLAHGMGDTRRAYRFLAPRLAASGFRVASLDLRGCGESSTGWESYRRADVAEDLLALVRHLGGPAVLVGHSFSGGSVTIAAAQEPDLVMAAVELAPFTRAQAFSVSGLWAKRHRSAMVRLLAAVGLGSPKWWGRYLEAAYPGQRPADFDAQVLTIRDELADPGRMQALRRMGQASPSDAAECLVHVARPTLVVQGALDPDWPDPVAEGEAIVAEMRPGVASLKIVDGAGHYPHAQFPEATFEAIAPFLAEHARA